MPQLKPPRPTPDVARLQAELEAAVKLHQAGKLDEAEVAYVRILERAPSQPDALNLLGVIQSERNRNERAIEMLSRAARFRPKDGNILNNLGRACVRARKFEQAIEALEHALSLSPNLVESLGNLIQAHRAAGNIEEAEYFVEVLRDKKGGSVTADFENARLLSDLDRRAEARELLEKITRETPQFAPAWNALARLEKVREGGALIDGLMAAVAEAPEPSSSMRFLCYAAAKAFDDLGEYDRAFEFVLRAKRQDPPTYDPDKTRTHFKNIAEVFNANFLASREGYGVPSERPVFIVGMPRSGTSLAEQILASHPDVFGGGELEFIGQMTSQLADYVSAGKHPGAAVELTKETCASLGFRYLRKIHAINQTAARFTDKMPHNFLSLGLLRLTLPNARVIHCVRHPYDTALSCFTHDFSHSHDYNQSLEGLAHYYVQYRELMDHWADCIGANTHQLQYERVIADQENESRGLLSFLGLDWRDDVLNFAETERRVTTPSSWQVRQPLYATSSGRWKNYESHLLPALAGIPDQYFP